MPGFTDKLAKGKPNYVEWTSDDDAAFEHLKTDKDKR
jgi:hypothetical protein